MATTTSAAPRSSVSAWPCPGSPSQRQFADMLQLAGFDIGKNGIQQIECGARFVTDIELKTLVKVLGVSYEDLLEGGA